VGLAQRRRRRRRRGRRGEGYALAVSLVRRNSSPRLVIVNRMYLGIRATIRVTLGPFTRTTRDPLYCYGPLHPIMFQSLLFRSASLLHNPPADSFSRCGAPFRQFSRNSDRSLLPSFRPPSHTRIIVVHARCPGTTPCAFVDRLIPAKYAEVDSDFIESTRLESSSKHAIARVSSRACSHQFVRRGKFHFTLNPAALKDR